MLRTADLRDEDTHEYSLESNLLIQLHDVVVLCLWLSQQPRLQVVSVQSLSDHLQSHVTAHSHAESKTVTHD